MKLHAQSFAAHQLRAWEGAFAQLARRRVEALQ